MEVDQDKLQILRKLIEKRGEDLELLDQRSIDEASIINRINLLHDKGLLNKRILCIGDHNMTGVAMSIFGNPSEVVITDIDRRLSEILFEAHIEYDLEVRYLYHDMRLRILEILMNQYELVVFEPPFTKAGIELWISRALECLVPNGDIIISVPSTGPIREFFNEYIKSINLDLISVHEGINHYTYSKYISDVIHLKANEHTKISLKGHFLEAFYEHEEFDNIKHYKCKCGEIIQCENILSLMEKGCPVCAQKEVFVFDSKVKLE
ncbi:MAG: bis-aminopropyl spermidine synthase family protein [Candidatus Heimdallarchaeota archaeon]|nr:bis-aminopropyl spermidine synthase family protein [Candidatus Heimdallarchaeota archaeon]